MTTTTGVWNDVFEREGRFFHQPHEAMPALLRALRERGARRLLDMGSGTGRHVVFFARAGLATHGIDIAPAGLRLTREWLASEGLTANLCRQDLFRGLPYRDESFDAVISVQVIHHADRATIGRAVAEIGRVLRPGGTVLLTVPKLRNQGTTYRQIEPATYIPLDGKEAGLPHHYFTPASLRALLDGFAVADVSLDRVNHYCALAVKR